MHALNKSYQSESLKCITFFCCLNLPVNHKVDFWDWLSKCMYRTEKDHTISLSLVGKGIKKKPKTRQRVIKWIHKTEMCVITLKVCVH